MRPTLLVAAVLLLGPMVGCGGGGASGTNAVAKAGPDGGTMYPLPGGKGFVEIRIEAGAGAPARNARTRGRTASAIVATFYQPDGTTALSPTPTEVRVKLGTDEANKVVDLSPAQGGPKSPGRFASAQGDYPDLIRGTLTATLDGGPVEVPFSAR